MDTAYCLRWPDLLCFPGTYAVLQDFIFQPPAPCILLKDFRTRRTLYGRSDEEKWSVIEAVTLRLLHSATYGRTLRLGNCAASAIATCFGLVTVSPTDKRRSALACRIYQPLLLLVIK